MAADYRKILTAILGECWAIQPEKIEAIIEVVRLRAEGVNVEPAAPPAEARRGGFARAPGGVAVIPVMGVIAQRMSMLEESSGGVSAERIGQLVDEAANDSTVGAIVLNMDSPGGSVAGIEALANKVYTARDKKTIYAVSNSLMASAAYWIGSQATKIVADPGAEVGSIGVIAMHQDLSGAFESAGVKNTILKVGKFKGEGNPFEPLTEDARAAIQKRLGEYYDTFVSQVARGRGVKPSEVRNGFGEGRAVGAKEGQSLGMVDKVMTLEQLLSDLAGRPAIEPGGRAVDVARYQQIAREQRRRISAR